MLEQPRPKRESAEELPKYLFEKAWLESNFLIPENTALRGELRQQYLKFSEHQLMDAPENEKTKRTLLARIAAIDSYGSEIESA